MTADIRTILTAVDFGEASARALSVAGAIAGRLGARLIVLHAESLDAPPYFTAAQIEVIEGEAQANRARALEFLRVFAAEHTQHPVEVIVDNRAATDAILHASGDVDLVVMGTHGRRGPSRWWLGSVAERVLRETRVPLMVMHAGPATPAAELLATAVLVPSEGSSAEHARAAVAKVAAAFTGTVVETSPDDVDRAREAPGATWVVVSTPTPRTGHWLSHVGEPLITNCSMPVLFVPEAQGGPAL